MMPRALCGHQLGGWTSSIPRCCEVDLAPPLLGEQVVRPRTVVCPPPAPGLGVGPHQPLSEPLVAGALPQR